MAAAEGRPHRAVALVTLANRRAGERHDGGWASASLRRRAHHRQAGVRATDDIRLSLAGGSARELRQAIASVDPTTLAPPAISAPPCAKFAESSSRGWPRR